MSTFGGNTRAALAVVCVAQFVVVLDATIVITAMPAVQQSLAFPAADLHWVITAYTLVFGGFLILGGRVADLVGPRRAFCLGLAVFVLASIGCALAWSPATLVVARAVEAAGSALLSPAALSLLTTLSEPGPARRRAVAWWTAAAASGGASGWVLGGLLTQSLGWRSVFWVNLPIGIATLAIALYVLPRGERARDSRLDVVGALTVTAALSLAVYGLTSIGARGLATITGWALLLGCCLLVVFVRYENRASQPLLPARLLRSRTVAGAGLSALALTATTTPAMYLCTIYMQQVLHLSPARASLLFPAFNIAVIAGSLAGPPALRHLGPRNTLVAGFATIGAGTALLAVLSGGLAVAALLGAFTLMGMGLGTASVASTQAGTEAADEGGRGAAAGMLNSAAQIGTAAGLALLTPLATSTGSDVLAGYRVGFIGTCALAAAGLASSFLLPSRNGPPEGCRDAAVGSDRLLTAPDQQDGARSRERNPWTSTTTAARSSPRPSCSRPT